MSKKLKISFFLLSSLVDFTDSLDASHILLIRYINIMEMIVDEKKKIRSTASLGIELTMRRRTFGITIVNQIRLKVYVLVNLGTRSVVKMAIQDMTTDIRTLTGVFI
jgi:hypothetical protein